MAKPKRVKMQFTTNLEMKKEIKRLAEHHYDGDVEEFVLGALRAHMLEWQESEREAKVNQVLKDYDRMRNWAEKLGYKNLFELFREIVKREVNEGRLPILVRSQK